MKGVGNRLDERLKSQALTWVHCGPRASARAIREIDPAKIGCCRRIGERDPKAVGAFEMRHSARRVRSVRVYVHGRAGWSVTNLGSKARFEGMTMNVGRRFCADYVLQPRCWVDILRSHATSKVVGDMTTDDDDQRADKK